MDIATLCQYLDDPCRAAGWLRSLGLLDLRRAHTSLMNMASAGVTLDLLAVLCDQLAQHLPACADPDMALNNLERFLASSRNPLSLAALMERDPTALPPLVQIFSTSQHLSDVLVNDPEAYDLLRLTEGQPADRELLIADLSAEVAALEHDAAVLRALRRFKRRETLRIAYGDIIREQSMQTVTKQISYLADAIVEAAIRAAWRKVASSRGRPIGPDGKPARFVALGMGKLGGMELNYSSDIDLIFLYDGDGKTEGPKVASNIEFFDWMAREIIRLLTESTDLGAVYRVDLRLRPDGQRGAMVPSASGALAYYDTRGRTWERQAYIKARPVAGDIALGRDFLRRLEPWIWRRYLTRTDIAGIKALKRRIEQHACSAGADRRDVKTGWGGIRDIEFTIQFLQLLNGGDLPELRTGSTLEAIVQLAHAGCLSDLERTLLEENYAFLRKIEHRLQILFDLQTHMLPEGDVERRKLALRMGYEDGPESGALATFTSHFQEKTELNRKILDHLLHDAFGDDTQEAAEADLVLDPDPPESRIAEVLGKYPFRNLQLAHKNLMALAEEKIRFLSTRRCRHFLAAIAPQLLLAISETTDPDSTLVNLGEVSDSLGSKGVLWELFSFNPPTLRLYVELCASSPFLSGILTSNPGMIDGLMDSLVLDRLPSAEFLDAALAELCRGAEDIDPILHSFKNDQQLCVGMRDLLNKEDVQTTTNALSDIARACLRQIADREFGRLVQKFGPPLVGAGRRAGRPCEMAILGMGKFGGREMNYHSDLDIVFLYEAEGHTAPEEGRGQATSNQHFFSELGQRIIKGAGHLGSLGRLYEVDARLRPTGKSGSLACSLGEFARYFAEGSGQLWERQALCKASVVYGTPRAAKLALAAVHKAAFKAKWRSEDAEAIRHMRRRMEGAASAGDLKRGPGGLVDIEFLVQMLQLKHAGANPKLRSPNTLLAMAELYKAGCLEATTYELFHHHYRLLRGIEGRLRLMNSTARDQLPQDPRELAKLAHLTRYPDAEMLLRDFSTATAQIRDQFNAIIDAEK